jgi:hypothetical protein
MQGHACCVLFELFVSQSEKSPEQNGSSQVNPAKRKARRKFRRKEQVVYGSQCRG